MRIAEETALRAPVLLASRKIQAVVLPPLPYGVTEYAGAFDGTLSVPAALVIASIDAVARAAVRKGAVGFAITNAHLSPPTSTPSSLPSPAWPISASLSFSRTWPRDATPRGSARNSRPEPATPATTNPA